MIAPITASITTLMFDVLVAVVKCGVITFPLVLLHPKNFPLIKSLAFWTSRSGPEDNGDVNSPTDTKGLMCKP